MNHRHQPSLPSEVDFNLEEIEALIWDLLDEQLDEAGYARLSQLLEKNAAVRERYMECIQLHVDLQEHFGRQAPGSQQAGAATVLSGLPGVTGLPGFPTVVR
jgi:hypothetical protein